MVYGYTDAIDAIDAMLYILIQLMHCCNALYVCYWDGVFPNDVANFLTRYVADMRDRFGLFGLSVPDTPFVITVVDRFSGINQRRF